VDIELLRERAGIIRQVRAFFDERDYLETDTPLLAPDLIPESCLEVFQTTRIFPNEVTKPYWLIPSPEIWMKRLIAKHAANIYQICKCFRNGESSGYQHSPEFTMLEYYTMRANYIDSLRITEELFAFLVKDKGGCGKLSPPFIKLTVEEAFQKWAGFSLFDVTGGGDTAESAGAMEGHARRLGLNPPSGLSVHALYDLIFIHAVEPQINLSQPVVLMDYPAFVPCLAKKSADGKTVERWELYARGTELANCFTEEIRAQEVRRFFESEKAEKEKNALVRHAVDENYWKIFDGGNSAGGNFTGGKFANPCSGVAMGLDRLIMILKGRKTLDGILPFPME
jgi:lysyl-tRNA synthetase class 2